jgi:hypothetical protein
MTSGTARELDYVSSVRSLDCLFGQRGAVETHVDQSLGKTLSVQLRDQGVNKRRSGTPTQMTVML